VSVEADDKIGGAAPGPRRSVAARAAAAVLVALIRVYQYCLSPWLGGQCRFVPTCSQYALEAVTRHGPLWGAWMTLKRLGRCRPGGGSGYDPVDAEYDH
jgi:putative membrane protein insertion efficiency factor